MRTAVAPPAAAPPVAAQPAGTVTHRSTAGTVRVVDPLHDWIHGDVTALPGGGRLGLPAVACRSTGARALAYVSWTTGARTLHLEEFPAGCAERHDGAPQYPTFFGDIRIDVDDDHATGVDVAPADLARIWLEYGPGLTAALADAHDNGATWPQALATVAAATSASSTEPAAA